jgi:hypothetical protein
MGVVPERVRRCDIKADVQMRISEAISGMEENMPEITARERSLVGPELGVLSTLDKRENGESGALTL